MVVPRAIPLFAFALLCCGCHDDEAGGVPESAEFADVARTYAAVVEDEPGPLLQDTLTQGDTLRVEIDATGTLTLGDLGDPIALVREPTGDDFSGTVSDGALVYDVRIEDLTAVDGRLALTVQPLGGGAVETVVMTLREPPDLLAIDGIWRATVTQRAVAGPTPRFFAFDIELGPQGLLRWPGISGRVQLVELSGSTLVGRVTGRRLGAFPSTAIERAIVTLEHDAGLLRSGRFQVLVDDDRDGLFEAVREDLRLAFVDPAFFTPTRGTFVIADDRIDPVPSGEFGGFFVDRSLTVDPFGNATMLPEGSAINAPLTLGFDGTSLVGVTPIVGSAGTRFEEFRFDRTVDGAFAGTGLVTIRDEAGAGLGTAGVDIGSIR